jgi:transposase
VENRSPGGALKKCKTYRIILSPVNDQALSKVEKHDGIWILATNIDENNQVFNGSRFKSFFGAYRMKNNIEEAFRILSDFNEIEPFYVYKEKHVKAHFTICVLAYLISITITNKVRGSKKIENASLHNIFKEIRKCKQDIIEIAPGKTIANITQTTPKQKQILDVIGCSSLVSTQYLRANNIVYV